MIYVWTGPRASSGARDLVNKIRDLGGEAQRVSRWPTGAGLIVCWGRSARGTNGTILNARLVGNKYRELQRLAAAGIPVPPHSQTAMEGWLARRFGHHEANDLLAQLATGDYYTQFVPLVNEFRIHVFRGASIRAGIKQPRAGVEAHPRFRSYAGGWWINYGATAGVLRERVRDTARRAVAALGYDFGAVDIGTQPDGAPIVLEVNSAPGLEGNTVHAYARHIMGAIR